MIDWHDITAQINTASGLTLNASVVKSVGGGSINSAYLLGEPNQGVFVKTNRPNQLGMFLAEAAGLASLSEANAIAVPTVYCTGKTRGVAFIAMQALKIGRAKTASKQQFGSQLAAMHRFQKQRFGAAINNTIGYTQQVNTWHDNWFTFWRENRLNFQLDLAKNNGAAAALIDNGFDLSERFEVLFDSTPKAACLHGDLWQGNWGFDESGQPLIFDPAHYFGDRETDIAMTKLFGRASDDFYAAYQDAYPLRPDYAIRETFYNIYHILNHYNLFGGGYADQAQKMIQSVLSEIR